MLTVLKKSFPYHRGSCEYVVISFTFIKYAGHVTSQKGCVNFLHGTLSKFLSLFPSYGINIEENDKTTKILHFSLYLQQL